MKTPHETVLQRTLGRDRALRNAVRQVTVKHRGDLMNRSLPADIQRTSIREKKIRKRSKSVKDLSSETTKTEVSKAKLYSCDVCSYSTQYRQNYYKHNTTKQHVYKISQRSIKKSYEVT